MFKDKLRFLREYQKLSQRETAKILGIGQATYNRYETGQREPHFTTLKSISALFNVSIDYLLDNDSILDRIDLNQFIRHGNYSIHSNAPTPADRAMLDEVVSAIYRKRNH